MNYRVSRSLFLRRLQVQYACEECSTSLVSPMTEAGQRDKCPECGYVFVVPGKYQSAMQSTDSPGSSLEKSIAAAAAKRPRLDLASSGASDGRHGMCDLCNQPGRISPIPADDMRRYVREGLRPEMLSMDVGGKHLQIDAASLAGLFGLSSNQADEAWLERVETDPSNWMLCTSCFNRAIKLTRDAVQPNWQAASSERRIGSFVTPPSLQHQGNAQHLVNRCKAQEANDDAVRANGQGRIQEARQKWKMSLEADPSWSVSHLNFARFLYSQKEFQTSARHVNRAKENARASSDAEHDSRVLRDAEILEVGLSAHGAGKQAYANVLGAQPAVIRKAHQDLNSRSGAGLITWNVVFDGERKVWRALANEIPISVDGHNLLGLRLAIKDAVCEHFSGRSHMMPEQTKFLFPHPLGGGSAQTIKLKNEKQAETPKTPCRCRARTVLRERVRLDYSERGKPSESLVDIARKACQVLDNPISDPEFTSDSLGRDRQRKEVDALQQWALDRLVHIPETAALEFFRSVGIDDPVKLRSGNAESVFTNMRTRARIGADEFGDLLFFSIGATQGEATEFLYVHQVDGRQAYGLLACKLKNGALFAYNTSGEMRSKLQLD